MAEDQADRELRLSLLRKIADLAIELEEAGQDGDVTIEVGGHVMRELGERVGELRMPPSAAGSVMVTRFGHGLEDTPAEVRIAFPFGYIIFRRERV